MPELSLSRVLIEMAVIAAVGSLIGFLFFSAKAGFGVLVGGGLAFANYYWQRQSLAAIFDLAVKGEKARFLGLKYALRYVVIGGVLLLIYLSDAVSIVGVVFGLATFAFAVVIEAVRGLFANSSKREV
jgi:ATP synthase I chain